MKIRGRSGNLCILPSLFLPTTCPRTKPALLHLTAACGKTFLLSLLSHSPRLKNATFLFLLPRGCQQLLSTVQSPCERWSRGGDPLAPGSGSRNCPGQEARPAPSSPGTHPWPGHIQCGWSSSSLHWFSNPGTLGVTGVTRALSTAHSSTGP